MKRSKLAAAATRQQIIAIASSAFSADGIADTGLADIMVSAGMTHGGFYRHFESKSHLVHEALSHGIEQFLEKIRHACATAPDGARFDAIISDYLSPDHRDNPAGGCPFAALAAEITRMEADPRRLMTDGLQRLASIIAESVRSAGRNSDTRALASISTMVGAIILARVVSDPEFSTAILAAASESLQSDK